MLNSHSLRLQIVVLTTMGMMLASASGGIANGAEAASKQQVIVMTTGRVLTGVLMRNRVGWLVEQQAGRIQVPEDQVKVIADSLPDAYRKQRDGIVEPTPATHIMLAQWCISFHLYDEARDELKQCLKRDPDHEEARRLLKRVEETLNPRTAALPKPVEPLKNAYGFDLPEVESLGGMSKETATYFTSRVQPLLVNKCGNASCHGTNSTSGFKLSVVRIGGNANRLLTERNLAEVLKLINVQEPSQSQLITVPQGNHGGTAAMFSGAGGSEQLKTMRMFVKTVATEKRKQEEELAARPSIAGRKKPSAEKAIQTASAVSNDESSIEDEEQIERPRAKGRSDSVAEPTGGLSKVKTASLEESVENQDDSPRDPFDPEQFNRRFHSSPKKTAR